MKDYYNLIFLLVLAGCSNNTTDTSSINKEIVVDTVAGNTREKEVDLKNGLVSSIIDTNEVLNDTFISTGNELVFIKPNNQEFKELLVKDEDINEANSDFNFYLNKSKPEIESLGYKLSVPTQRYIKIVAFDSTISHIDRHELGENLHYGILRNYEKSEPVLEIGIFTDLDILSFCQDL